MESCELQPVPSLPRGVVVSFEARTLSAGALFSVVLVRWPSVVLPPSAVDWSAGPCCEQAVESCLSLPSVAVVSCEAVLSPDWPVVLSNDQSQLCQ